MKPWHRTNKLELALLNRLRAWYWHVEVERKAIERFDGQLEAQLKAGVYRAIARLIRFFVEDEALLLAPAETESNDYAGKK